MAGCLTRRRENVHVVRGPSRKLRPTPRAIVLDRDERSRGRAAGTCGSVLDSMSLSNLFNGGWAKQDGRKEGGEGRLKGGKSNASGASSGALQGKG